MIDPGREIRACCQVYKIVQYLGKGGNASTYHVIRCDNRDSVDREYTHGFGSNYAMKLAREDLSGERLERFHEEMDFLRDAEHPSVLPFHESGEFYDSPFMIIEYLPDTLEEVILSDHLTMAEKLNYALQLTSSLVYIHNLDDPVVHRDIKPSNIFVRQNSSFLGDFGMMKRMSTNNEDINLFKESSEEAIPYQYPTPELISYENGGSLSPKSDVFQLGAVLAELFTARSENPLPDKEEAKSMRDIRVAEIGNIPGTTVSRNVKSIIEEMLTVDQADRPEAAELIGKWEELLENAAEEERSLNGTVL